MTTERKLYEIEVGLSKLEEFNFVKNLVVFNVNGSSSILFLDHECDVLVLSKSGYLTEIEIKRSWEDFKADFKKKYFHNSCGVIKRFYYCVSELFADKVVEYLKDNNVDCYGVIVYNEKGDIGFEYRMLHQSSDRISVHKLYIEQQLYLAKLGSMRAIGLKEKILELGKSNREYLECIKVQDSLIEGEMRRMESEDKLE